MSNRVGGLVAYICTLAASARMGPIETFERVDELQVNMWRSDYTEAEAIMLANALMPVYVEIESRTNGRVSNVANQRVRELGELLA